MYTSIVVQYVFSPLFLRWPYFARYIEGLVGLYRGFGLIESLVEVSVKIIFLSFRFEKIF